jgi:transposase
MAIVFVGIDLTKNVFAVHGVDEHGKPALVRSSVARVKLHALIASLPPCTIGMEACSGAYHWARLFAAAGHTVRLIAPKFVAPYRLSGKRGKPDAADAAAICEDVQRPRMRFVPVKSLEQQALLTLHRERQGFIEQRTGLINRIRGLLSEFGIVMPLKTSAVRLQASEAMENLTGCANLTIGDCVSELHRLDERILQCDRHLAQQARPDARAQRLMRLNGIAETTATALVAAVATRTSSSAAANPPLGWA